MRVTLFALLLLLGARDARALDVTSCGTTVPEGETGVLLADLDCTGTGTFAVQLLRRATLELNNHMLIGGPIAPTVDGVRDATTLTGSSNFVIHGPGTIAGTAVDQFPFPGSNTCVSMRGGRAEITSDLGVVDIYGCDYGVAGSSARGRDGRLVLEHAIVHDHHVAGVSVRALRATNVEVHHHFRGMGLAARRTMRVSYAWIHHNNTGLGARTIKGTDMTASDNIGPDPNAAGGNAIFAESSVTLTNLVAMNNQNPGVGAKRVKLINSHLGNNGTGPTHHLVDIQSESRPRLINTYCLHSEASGPHATGPDWDVCLQD